MPKATKPTATTTTTAATKRRQSTVYDAVASRVNYAGFIKPRQGSQGYYRSAVARPADEVLSRRLRAPEDVSCARRDQDEQVAAGLPDSELVLAIHQYAADFYAANGMADVGCRSMDETALIAIGLLLECTIEDLLGESGHVALADRRAPEEEGAARDLGDSVEEETEIRE